MAIAAGMVSIRASSSQRSVNRNKRASVPHTRGAGAHVKTKASTLECKHVHTVEWASERAQVIRNASPSELIEYALEMEAGSTHLDARGALATRSGKKTGRSPKDKRVVKEPKTERSVWWGAGSPNVAISEEEYLLQRNVAIEHLSSKDHLFVIDGFADWNKENRVKVRIVCTRPYHALFMHNMLIRPTQEELATFKDPDLVIYNAGERSADAVGNMTSGTAVCMHLSRGEMVVLGTEYAGEMKKGVFTFMNYLAPKNGRLSLHSGCNVGQDGDTTLFFGLSGTGKTTLSADEHRPLVGDDEHIWGDQGISNIEGGCYAKCINLKKEREPQIFEALKYGAVLENVVLDPITREVDFDDNSITDNTRASYPVEFVKNAVIPCCSTHPKHIIMLCCDAFGVLPPVAKLTNDQAMYHFVSGYSAKVAGTEVGVSEPQATFSACFGSAFLVWHPTKYAALLAEKMSQHGTTAWLVNTGWTGGAYGVGHRMPLSHTRAIIDAIHSGELLDAEYETLSVFNLQIPLSCSGVPSEELNPARNWPDIEGYRNGQEHLAKLFIENFEQYMDPSPGTVAHLDTGIVDQIFRAGPSLP